jgi:hypothetical protein
MKVHDDLDLPRRVRFGERERKPAPEREADQGDR